MDKLVGLPCLLVGVGSSLDVALPSGRGGSRVSRAGFGVWGLTFFAMCGARGLLGWGPLMAKEMIPGSLDASSYFTYVEVVAGSLQA